MNRAVLCFVFAGASSPLTVAVAQSSNLPPIRPLAPAVVVGAESLGTVTAIRALSNGSVLVNDMRNRRVLLFDSTLKVLRVVADSTSNTANAYGGRVGGLIPYKGDSTLFVDPASSSMLVIDATGKIVRVMSVPRSQDAMFLSGLMGAPAFDASGRLVYRSFARPSAPPTMTNGRFVPPEMPDSAPLVRVDMLTRKLDTAAWLKTAKVKMTVSQLPNGGISVMSQINPMPVVDDWTVTSDGTIAVVRARDYHVDFVKAGGTIASSPKIPFEWQRLTDDDKSAFIDSVRTASEKARESAANGSGGRDNTVVGGGGGGRTFTMQIGPGGPGGPGGPQVSFISPNELPDYRPPFGANNAVHADLDGNIWVQTSLVKPFAGPIYDVINGRGELIDRVQMQPGRTIVGFGAGGAVYLAAKDGAVTKLERARAH